MNFTISVDTNRVDFVEQQFFVECLGADDKCEFERNPSFVHIDCNVSDPINFWKRVQVYLRENSDVADACIVICEGSQGWDDYLLLHHFDSQDIDTFPD